MGRSVLSLVQRYRAIDAVRGFALFGVLLVNLYGFGADSLAWDGVLDRVFWQLKHALFESKFWGLFSLLFGISFWLQTRSGVQHWRLLRRYSVLMIFGCCHALLFEGDILMLYAEFGLLLLLLHKCSNRVLVAIAITLLLVFPLGHYWDPDRGFSDTASTVAEARQWLAEDREDSLYSRGLWASSLQSMSLIFLKYPGKTINGPTLDGPCLRCFYWATVLLVAVV